MDVRRQSGFDEILLTTGHLVELRGDVIRSFYFFFSHLWPKIERIYIRMHLRIFFNFRASAYSLFETNSERVYSPTISHVKINYRFVAEFKPSE